MKEMPERIYLFDCNDALTTPLEGDTEYIRKDSFIKKVCEFIETYPHLFMGVLRSEVIEDFKKYMEEKI